MYTVYPIFGAVAFRRKFDHAIANSGDIFSPVSTKLTDLILDLRCNAVVVDTKVVITLPNCL